MRNIFFILLCFAFFLEAQEDFDDHENELPHDVSIIFSGSGNCIVCHESDGDLMYHEGKDVSPVSQWRSTMMANAAKDPLWRAKVSAEVSKFPTLKKKIETKCTTCHSPMGKTRAFVEEFKKSFSIAQMEKSELARDGVSCTVCHQIQDKNLGKTESFNGGYVIDESNIIYGPYKEPFQGPMMAHTGYTPEFSSHIRKSELCATCHTLFNSYEDKSGKVKKFPEQVPYFEWKNSLFPSMEMQCQTCHMPPVNKPMDISTAPPFHQVKREPYLQHYFVGANIFMLQLLKHNIQSLGLKASKKDFDATILRTAKQLNNETILLDTKYSKTQNQLNFAVTLQNLAGHKLPTGIPLRRMWIYFKVTEDTGKTKKTIFESGKWNKKGEILNLDAGYEPHYDKIDNENQVQIYETVMQDIEQKLTYSFVAATNYFKDNRIPPLGFTRQHADYAVAKIHGKAEKDPNFGQNDGVEGSGKDTVTYQIPYNSQSSYQVEIEICFQSVTPRMLKDLFRYSTPEIERFKKMYQRENNEPHILKSLTINIPKTPKNNK